MNRISFCLISIFIYACNTAQTPSQISSTSSASSANMSIEDFTGRMEKFSGYFNFYYDNDLGRIWLEIDKFNTEFLYVNSLPAGIGSNDIGLDRGQLGDNRVVKFTKHGPKIFLVQPNYDYRAVSDNDEEKKSVEQAFAQSVLWGFEIVARSDWKVLIDLTPFLLRDAHGITDRLSDTKQGKYSIDPAGSALYLPMIRNFPENSEFEATLTFRGEPSGDWIRSVVPTPELITVRTHHSFIQLPGSQYKPRKFDPRAGYNFISFQDYATPIEEPLVKRFIRRHRLEKQDPDSDISEPVEPIIYYLDRGTPEPVRSALIEGATWWNEAFEAAGYRNAFRVEMLPEDADPMDVRYNLIQWVHRSTRGWSYGASVYDPRTGEIIKGHVSLGSLRVRQDFLIAEGLLGPYEGDGTSEEMLEMSLARLRQLSAHEVGHTLGIVHNFAASYNNRSSVMDYPHPLVTLDDSGKIDLSEAYDTNIGEWDIQVIKYGYSDFSDATTEDEELEKILKESQSMGLLHISDADARPRGGAHPLAHLWDNNSDPASELLRMLEIRKKILSDFGKKNIKKGFPMSALEEVLVPIYLFHRYQIEAAVKVLGGLNYSYAVKGDSQLTTEIISGVEQRKALDALLSTITPENLALSEELLIQIPPRAFGFPRSRETFRSRTGVTFDALGIAETAANMTISLLLHPERASRLVEYSARDNSVPGLSEVIRKLVERTWKTQRTSNYGGEIRRVVDRLVLFHLMELAVSKKASEQARAIALAAINDLTRWAGSSHLTEQDPGQKAHLFYAENQMNKFLKDPEMMEVNRPIDAPDGSPIGQYSWMEDEVCSWK